MNLTVWEPSGVNRMGWPVTVGVPFPKGVFLKEDNSLYMTEAEFIKVEYECRHRITVRCYGKFKNTEPIPET